MTDTSELKPVHRLSEKFQAASCSSHQRGHVIAGTAGGMYFFWQLGLSKCPKSEDFYMMTSLAGWLHGRMKIDRAPLTTNSVSE